MPMTSWIFVQLRHRLAPLCPWLPAGARMLMLAFEELRCKRDSYGTAQSMLMGRLEVFGCRCEGGDRL